MNYQITNENLIIVHGGHATPGSVRTKDTRGGEPRVVSATFGLGTPGLGHQRHYPIFKDDKGIEYISLNGQTLTPISNIDLDKHARRETVERGS